jgi:HEAT repeat protein
MRTFRTRFGVRALIAYVGLCALLFWAMRVSRDSRPPHLYAGWLSDGDVSRRLQAAQELDGMGSDPDVVAPALVRSLLTDSAASVRKRSAVSLAGVVSKLNDGPTTVAATSAFVQALKDKDAGVRAAAAEGLGRIGPEPEAVVPALLRGIGDESEWVRGAAVVALGWVQRKAGVDRAEARSAIAAAMSDSSLHVRELGIYAFWAMAEKSPEFSIAFLKDGDVTTRRSAVTALARSAPLASSVVPELTTALTDEDAAVRGGAARALRTIGPPSWAALPPDLSPR